MKVIDEAKVVVAINLEVEEDGQRVEETNRMVKTLVKNAHLCIKDYIVNTAA